jgi:hypothetical protein
MSATVAASANAFYGQWLWLSRNPTEHSQAARYRPQKVDYISQFYRSLKRWRAETAVKSRIGDKIDHPAFNEIVRIGEPAIPLIVKELYQKPDFLFVALQRITGEDPTPDNCERFSDVVEAWLSWAERTNVPAD